MGRPVVLLGPGTYWFRDAIRSHLEEHAIVVEVESKLFPDGESYVRIPLESLDNRRVLVVQSLGEPQDRSLWQLMLMVDAARRLGGRVIGVYAPYLAYSRQDKVFLKGEPVSVEVLLKTLRWLGSSYLFTVDVHSPPSLESFEGKAFNLLAFDQLSRIIREKTTGTPLVLAPDKGAIHRAEHVARLLGSDYDYLVKKRDKVTGEVTLSPKSLPVEGRSVVIVDDIISTGGTVAKAASLLLQQGAKEVVVAVSHALMAGNAREKLSGSGVEKVLSLNTLPPREGVVYVDATPSVKNVLAEFLEAII